MPSTASSTHPDFSLPWCRALLTSPTTEILEVPTHDPKFLPASRVSNSMFLRTLYTPSAIRAQINFRRPALSSTSLTSNEYCLLLSIGDGVDGKQGRAHGGFNALILDHVLGYVASLVSGHYAPATATMTVDYKRPINTPGVILCRGWAIEKSGRKTWVKGAIEDGEGRMLAEGKALFVGTKESKA